MTKLKWSNYVIPFDCGKNVLLYKSISETLFKTSKEEWKIINEFINGEETNKLNDDVKKHIAELYVDKILIDRSHDDVNAFKSTYIEKLKNSTSGTVYFAPSFRCNLRCSYCVIGEQVKNPSDNIELDMSENNAIQSANWTYDMCIYHKTTNLTVVLYGGEPLLSQYNNVAFMNTLNNKIKENSATITIDYKLITNGFEVCEENIKQLVSLGASSVQITLDGPSTIHDKRRFGANKEKTFDTILKNIISLTHSFKNIVVRINVDNSNVMVMNELIDILYENNLQKICILHFNLVDPSDYSDISGYNEQTLSFFKDIYKYAFSKDFNIAPWRRYCSMPSNYFFAIDPKGLIYKCSNYLGMKEKAIGDIHSKIINDDLCGNIENKCLECKYIGICNGGCRIMRETSKIGNNYCFSNENHFMAQAYYEAKFLSNVKDKQHIKLLIND